MRNGWFYDSYRHSLAAKGIKTSYYGVGEPRLSRFKGMHGIHELRESQLAEKLEQQRAKQLINRFDIMKGGRNQPTPEEVLAAAEIVEELPTRERHTLTQIPEIKEAMLAEQIAEEEMHAPTPGEQLSLWGLKGIPGVREQLLAQELDDKRNYMRNYMRDYNQPRAINPMKIPEVREALTAEEVEGRRQYQLKWLKDKARRDELESAINRYEQENAIPEVAPIGKFEPYKTVLESSGVEHLGMAAKEI
jgi:hypothetical protein